MHCIENASVTVPPSLVSRIELAPVTLQGHSSQLPQLPDSSQLPDANICSLPNPKSHGTEPPSQIHLRTKKTLPPPPPPWSFSHLKACSFSIFPPHQLSLKSVYPLSNLGPSLTVTDKPRICAVSLSKERSKRVTFESILG